jgi:hypothetical protein
VGWREMAVEDGGRQLVLCFLGATWVNRLEESGGYTVDGCALDSTCNERRVGGGEGGRVRLAGWG